MQLELGCHIGVLNRWTPVDQRLNKKRSNTTGQSPQHVCHPIRQRVGQVIGMCREISTGYGRCRSAGCAVSQPEYGALACRNV
jgi:hypothetical protein